MIGGKGGTHPPLTGGQILGRALGVTWEQYEVLPNDSENCHAHQ